MTSAAPVPPPLNARHWALSGGVTGEWQGVMRLQVRRAEANLAEALGKFERSAPESSKRRYSAVLKDFASRDSAVRERLLLHPSFGFWLYWVNTASSAPWSEDDCRLRFGLFSGFAAWLALEEGRSGSFDILADEEGHLHLYGSPFYIELPAAFALQSIRVVLDKAGLRLKGPDGRSSLIARRIFEGSAQRITGGLPALRRSTELLPGLSVEICGPLHVHGVTARKIADLDRSALSRYAGVLASALEIFERCDSELLSEFREMMRVVIPLARPTDRTVSVSGTYSYLRGAICLSPFDDPLVQAETLIHEFCHQKLNRLMISEPIFEKAQPEQIYYSPWRPDPRPLKGLIFGAHAFVNVGRCLIKHGCDQEKAQYNSIRRLLQSRAALATAYRYGAFTDFGRRFMLELSRESERLLEMAQRFPPAAIEAAKKSCAAHQTEFSNPRTGLCRAK